MGIACMFYMTYYVHVISFFKSLYHIYVTVSHKITHSTKADMLTHVLPKHTPSHLTSLLH